MPEYICEKCGMEFKQKSHRDQHARRKTPCVRETRLKSYIAQVVEDTLDTRASSSPPVDYDIKTMRYLGNKSRHLEFIYEAVVDCADAIGVRSPAVFDAFGGTGAVSQFLNRAGHRVVSNDMSDYGHKLCYCRNTVVQRDLAFEGLEMGVLDVIAALNACRIRGFIYYNYSPNAELAHERKYFTNANAEAIDGARTQIEEWRGQAKITAQEYAFLVALLIESASLYSNIPGTYGAFNAKWDPRSTRPFSIDATLAPRLVAAHSHPTFNRDVRDLVGEVECDILYLDPPYNERDYSMYYHVLETISCYDSPELKDNKTGTKKEYNRSKWCSKALCVAELEYVVAHTRAQCVVMSYNNEGIIPIANIEAVFEKYGTYSVKKKLTRRFKCNDNDDTASVVHEYLHILIKSQSAIDTVPKSTSVSPIEEFIQRDKINSSSDAFDAESDDAICVELCEMRIKDARDSRPDEFGRIHNCCCIEGMKRLAPACIDLICTDLPYGMTECKWDTVIDLDKLWEQYARVLKPFGTVVLFGKQPFTSRLVASNYEMFKFSLVWQKSKPGGFAQAPYRILCEHEDILVFSHGKTAANAANKMTYNPQGTVPCNKPMRGKTGATAHRGNRKTQEDYVQTTANYPRSILKFGNEGRPQHPTQKPIELVKYLVRSYSNEGDVVLDSCMGSGTTALASIATNRRFVGYELDEKYFSVCNARISEMRAELGRAPPPDVNDLRFHFAADEASL